MLFATVWLTMPVDFSPPEVGVLFSAFYFPNFDFLKFWILDWIPRACHVEHAENPKSKIANPK